MGLKRSIVWLALVLFGMITAASAGAAHAATGQTTTIANNNRPSEAFSFTSVAVVRLVVTYADQQTSNPAPLACTGLGTIIATTGTTNQMGGTNPHSYILTDSSIVSPALPCQGAIAAYVTRYGSTPKAWRLDTIIAYLSTAYTGNAFSRSVAIDTTSLSTFGLNGGPIALALQTEPAVDLPTALVPAAQGPQNYAIDLGNVAALAYTNDSIALSQLGSAMTPLENAIGLPTVLPNPTPTSIPTAIPTGTVIATPTATIGPTATANLAPTATLPVGTITPLAPEISPGAPVVSDTGNGIGNLAGIIVATSNGYAIAGIQAINIALARAFVTSSLGAFSTYWQHGLDAYYAASTTNPHDPAYATALTQFTYLRSHYPDFAGIAPWIVAAQAGSPDPGGVAATPTANLATSGPIPGLPIHNRTELIALGVAVLALCIGILFWVRAILLSRRTARSAQRAKERPDTERLPAVAGGKSTANGAERRVKVDDLPPGWQTTSMRLTTPLPVNRKRARLGLLAGALTDAGIRRRGDPNQDNILVLTGARMQNGAPQPFGLFVVADGMGGHQSGQEASMRTIGVLVDAVLQPLLDGKNLDDEALLNLLRQGIEAANDTLNKRNLRLHSDMGTTITAALVTGDVASIANVGDSRTYHLQPTLSLRQITADHSVVAGLVAAGIIHPDDVYTHPKRNQIYRSLGESDAVDVDTFRIVLQPGDQLLLCSDGLWEMVRDPQIEAILRSAEDPQRIAEQMIQIANDNGGADNVSAIVVRMLDESHAPSQVGVNIIAGPPSLIGG